MPLYFRSRANSCSFMGSPSVHYEHTAASGPTHIREMHATTSLWILGLESVSTARARRTPFGLNVKGGDVSSPTHPTYKYTSIQIGYVCSFGQDCSALAKIFMSARYTYLKEEFS